MVATPLTHPHTNTHTTHARTHACTHARTWNLERRPSQGMMPLCQAPRLFCTQTIFFYIALSLFLKTWSTLQNDVDRLQAYASANYMMFKCKFMLVSRKRQHIHPNPSICLNGSPLELTQAFKYLGLLISSDIS